MTPKTFTHEDFSAATGDGEPASSVFTPPFLLAADVDREHYNRVMKALAENHRVRQEARQVQIATEAARRARARTAEPYTAKKIVRHTKEIEAEAKTVTADTSGGLNAPFWLVTGACIGFWAVVSWMLWRWATGKG